MSEEFPFEEKCKKKKISKIKLINYFFKNMTLEIF